VEKNLDPKYEKLIQKVLIYIIKSFIDDKKFKKEFPSEKVKSFANSFFRLFREGLKSSEVVCFRVLDYILTQKDCLGSFVRFSSIFVMNIVKSLSNSKNLIQEYSFRILGNLTSALFLQDEKNLDQTHLFEKDLLQQAQKGYTFIVNFKNPRNFEYPFLKYPKAELWPY
jgi:hypothetical protein